MPAPHLKHVPDVLAGALDAHLTAHFATGVRDVARDAMQHRWANMFADQLEEPHP